MSSHPSEKLLLSLQERAKELACLYEVEEILSRVDAPLEDLFQAVLRVIPPGWQYPEICQAQLEYGGQVYSTPDFLPTPWEMSADLVIQERQAGRLRVSYRAERPTADEGPFLREEGKLIRTIADRLGHFLLHRKLKGLFQELHQAQLGSLGSGESEWRFALKLLRRTDQELYVRIAWKMANHLAWKGIPEAQNLLRGFGMDRESGEDPFFGEKNQPTQKRPMDTVGDEVFALVPRFLEDGEILKRIQAWIQEDRAGFLVKIVMASDSTPADIADAIRRYLQLVQDGPGLSHSTLQSVRVALIRRFLSDELDYLKVAKEFIDLPEFLVLLDRLICLPGSLGRLGGKCAGVFLAQNILKQRSQQNMDLGAVRSPRTWFIASDGVLAFLRYNNLEEVYEQKYKSLEQVRQEYPHLVRVFQHGLFPPEVIHGLSVALDELGDVPLIVRSSSLLEDRLGAAFSGKYKSLFLSNQGSKRERLRALQDAVAEVYASIFHPDPIQYRAERGLLDFREEMGIMIQEVVGQRVGSCYLPAFAGVAVSHNEFRWSPRIRREDGLVRLVPGLGTRAVDRVGNDYPVLVSPGQPGLRVNVSPEEIVRYAPQCVDALDLERRSLVTLPIAQLLKASGAEYPILHRIVSVQDGDRIVKKPAVLLDFDQDEVVVTFEGLLKDTPFVGQMGAMLRNLQNVLGHPVDLEFASDGTDLYLLQCRPQGRSEGTSPAPIPKGLPLDRILFTAHRFVSNGRIPELRYIVYVDPEAYAALPELSDHLAVGRAVGCLNAILPRRQFILMGPGRWGSRGDVRLGVPVGYSDIHNTAALLEVARKRGGTTPDLSFGTHFFQDLVESSIRYLPLFPDEEGCFFNHRFFRSSPNQLTQFLPEYAHLSGVLKLIDLPEATQGLVGRLHLNADLDEAIAFLVESAQSDEESQHPEGLEADHWRWRFRMAETLAARLDGKRFGVQALYLIGSSKNASAGPASDIDLLIHIRNTPQQQAELEAWLEGWSHCLDELNYLRTGYRSEGLLDVHYLRDEDLAARSSYAVKINALSDPARLLKEYFA